MADETLDGRAHFARTPGDAGLIDLRQFGLLLWARRRLVLTITAIATVAATAYIVITPASYVAEATLLIHPRQPNITASQNVVDGLGQDAAMIESQVEVITSRKLLMPVFERLGLGSDPEFARTGLMSSLFEAVIGTRAAPSREEAYERFLKALHVERRGMTYVLSVGFRSEDPDKSAMIANFVADTYVAGQVLDKASTTAQVTNLLDDRVIELRAAVGVAEQAIEAYKASVGYVAINGNPALFETELIEVSRLLVAAEGEADTARRAYGQFADGATQVEDKFLVIDSPVATDLRRQFNERSTELSRMTGVLGDRHPTVVSQRLELDELRGQMATEVERITQQRQAELALAEQEVAALRTRVTTLKADAASMRQAEVQLRDLEREADARRAVLEEFMQRARVTDEQGTLQRADAEVISAAVAPAKAVWPNTLLILAAGLLAGLMGGCGLALFWGPGGGRA